MSWLDCVSTDFSDILSDIGTAITIQSYDETFNADGEAVQDYTDFFDATGVVEMRNGQEREQDERLQGYTFYDVFLDTTENLTPDMRVLYGALALNIEEVYPITAGVTVRQLRCTEVLESV